SRLAISGERTGRVTTRYISLPRNFIVVGSTLVGLSAMTDSLFWTIEFRLARGNAGLVHDVFPTRDLRFDAFGCLFRRAAFGKPAEIAQLLFDGRQGDHAAEFGLEAGDDRLWSARGCGRARSS